jgi:hypothetical protein
VLLLVVVFTIVGVTVASVGVSMTSAVGMAVTSASSTMGVAVVVEEEKAYKIDCEAGTADNENELRSIS